VLYIDVAKVDRDVAHVVMAIHVCFKCMFQMFDLFQTNVASVLSECCKVDMNVAYTCILQIYVSSVFMYVCLQVFHLDVACVCNGFQMFSGHFCKCFRRLFQVFHLSSFVCCNCCICIFKSKSSLHMRYV
jgi:hypothetical protein